MLAGMTTYIVLAIAAIVTSAISAIIGMGGGILLLAVLLSFLPHGVAIPIHAVVQLASNSTRVLSYLPHVDWRTAGRFCCGMIPGAVVGAMLLAWAGHLGHGEPYLKIAVGLYVLAAAFLPKPARITTKAVWWDFPLVGFLVGTAALAVGAIGPLIAPLFIRRGFVKERLVATKAVCQMMTHLAKIPAFLYLGTLDTTVLGTLGLVMVLMVIPGTIIGKRLLKSVSERLFVRLYTVALIVAGSKVLLIDGVWSLVRQ
jgi:uncharacterized protein